MPKNKTVPNAQSVTEFLNGVEDAQKRKDSFVLAELMAQVTGLAPTMWGSSIVGFGLYHYKYESGREGDMILAGFAPRKGSLTLYNMGSLAPDDELLQKLGKHTLEGSCLHIKRLADVDLPTLKLIIAKAFAHMQEKAKSA
jgi:hypothetical protein